MPPELPEVELQGIDVVDLDVIRCKSFAEMGNKARVFFDQSETARYGGEEFGEGTESRANLNDVVAGLDVEKGNDGTRKILVVQEVLSEAFCGFGSEIFQGALCFAQCHRLERSGFLNHSQRGCEQRGREEVFFPQVIHIFPA